VTVNCLHPGFVATRFADESGGLISHLAWLAKFFAISPAEGAQTIIYLASSPEVANVAGKYFYECRPTNPSALALDDRAALALGSAARLWQVWRNSASFPCLLVV
jgi:NAD(P)-dependent dehydrogenase (short-subunit alcohol dehydrogenase family)